MHRCRRTCPEAGFRSVIGPVRSYGIKRKTAADGRRGEISDTKETLPPASAASFFVPARRIVCQKAIAAESVQYVRRKGHGNPLFLQEYSWKTVDKNIEKCYNKYTSRRRFFFCAVMSGHSIPYGFYGTVGYHRACRGRYMDQMILENGLSPNLTGGADTHES